MNQTLAAKAAALARKRRAPYAVIEIDSGDDRCREVRPLSYCNSQEFEAFDGAIVAIYHPDGSTET